MTDACHKIYIRNKMHKSSSSCPSKICEVRKTERERLRYRERREEEGNE
jgi:hypothetical protein